MPITAPLAVTARRLHRTRPGRDFGLRVRRVDPLRARIDVAETIIEVRGQITSGPPKSKAGRRRVPLPRFVVDELVPEIAGCDATDLVWTAPKGGPLRGGAFRRRVWLPAVADAGLDGLRMHDLRHTAVALWISAGASVKALTTWAGHSSASTTLDRHGHLFDDAHTENVERLDITGRAASQSAASGVVSIDRVS